MLIFIHGGVILSIGLHHLTTDVSGLDGVLQYWAADTRNLAALFDSKILDRNKLTFSGPAPRTERFAELGRQVKFVKLLDTTPQPRAAGFQTPVTFGDPVSLP